MLGGIAFELVFTSAVIYLPVLQGIFGTRGLSVAQLAFLVPFPFVVGGCDETFR